MSRKSGSLRKKRIMGNNEYKLEKKIKKVSEKNKIYKKKKEIKAEWIL